MTARRYARLDRNRLGAGLLLDTDDLQITTAGTCDINRTVLGDLRALAGEFAFESYVWSTSRTSLANLIALGVAQPKASLATYVGGDAAGIGWLVADGKIVRDGAVIATVQPQGERVPLGIRLSLSPTACTCDFRVGNTVLYTATLPTGKAWLPALSLGSASPGDITACVNFGEQWRFDALPYTQGWSVQSAGLPVFYLSRIGEGFMSLDADLPANQPFTPCIINASKIKFASEPAAWYHRPPGQRYNPSSGTVIEVDNTHGEFNALLAADAKDAMVVYQDIDAPPGAVGSLAGAQTLFTGFIDRTSGPRRGVASITLRGRLATLDRPLRGRRVPPFYNPASAGRYVPTGIGARRNVRPLLLSEPDRLWLLGDAPQTNVPQVADQAAPLDPLAIPPQWTTALSGAGIQTQTLPEGRLSADCSSVGPQYEIPGAADVLAGDGQFTTWPSADGITTTPPNHFAWTGYAGSALMKFTSPPYAPGKVSLRAVSARPWYPRPYGSPPAPVYGDVLSTTSMPLLGGRSYRLTFRLPSVYAAEPARYDALRGGLMIRTKLSNDPADAVTAHGVAISIAAQDPRDRYVVDFTVPAGAPRNLYFLAVASGGMTAGSAVGTGGFEILDLNLELLGQWTNIPMADSTLANAVRELLVVRDGQPETIYSASDCAALDASEGHGFSLHYADAPNLLDAIVEATDQLGGFVYEDEFGNIRFGRFTDPETGPIVAAFSSANVDVDSVRMWTDTAPGLTRYFISRPNCDPFTGGDFVTNSAVVTPTIRQMYQGAGQFEFSTTAALAQEYMASAARPRRLLRIDDLAAAKRRAARDCGLFEKKRNWIQFDVLFSRLMVGIGPTIAPQKLYPGLKVVLDLSDVPDLKFGPRRLVVGPRALAPPPSGRLTITGWY